ncbi:acyl-CoA--sterol O-acyltransferase 1-like [Silene latifolia]|uniref:acyl-CoA--sterol O-acyltransferase 1-like n=1 Tax=Silene latifolia TaxID=37657 RepID=UPI003D771F48
MVELAEDEFSNFVKVWLSIFVSLSYCYIIGKIIPKGFARLIALLPVIALFFALPLNLTSLHLCVFTSLFISWLATFKLLLFAFGKPPLTFDPPLSFNNFLLVAGLPIKLHTDSPLKTASNLKQKYLQESLNENDPDHETKNKSYPSSHKSKTQPKISPWNYIIKVILLAVIVKTYDYSNQLPEKLLSTLHGFHIYFALELILACVAKSAKVFLGFDLEPQFNEPLLSTSLQDFWGRRWNIMVTSILRPTVYLPTLNFASKFVGQEMGKLVGVMASFSVSGIYHDLIFYYLGRLTPTFQVTWFFLLHGFCLCVEVILKKYFGGKVRVPRWISGIATVGFVIVTGVRLFMPPLLRAGLTTKGVHEYAVIGAFIKRTII